MKNIDRGNDLLCVSHVFDLSTYFSLIRRHLKLYKQISHQGLLKNQEEKNEEGSYSSSDSDSGSMSEDE